MGTRQRRNRLNAHTLCWGAAPRAEVFLLKTFLQGHRHLPHPGWRQVPLLCSQLFLLCPFTASTSPPFFPLQIIPFTSEGDKNHHRREHSFNRKVAREPPWCQLLGGPQAQTMQAQKPEGEGGEFSFLPDSSDTKKYCTASELSSPEVWQQCVVIAEHLEMPS